MTPVTNIELNNGAQMPILGFGTWQANEAELEAAVDNALKAGYRHIDTAYVYENEHVIGNVLKKWMDSGKLKREDLFIVTKLPPTGNRASSVAKYLGRSLKSLQLDYVDLYLIHVPFTWHEKDEENHPMDENNEILIDTSTDNVAVWKEMEKQVDAGLVKSIGVSNFNISQIERVLANSRILPSSLQIELHVYFQQKELVDYCASKGIIVTAYSPLGSRGLSSMLVKMGIKKSIPDLMDNPVVLAIAKKHNVESSQVLLRYIVQRGVAAIPKSTTENRIKLNINIFHFKLDDDDMKLLYNLDQGAAARICDFSFIKGADKHPEFPWKIMRHDVVCQDS